MVLRLSLSKLWRHVVVIVIGTIMIYPVLWMISSSFKPNAEIFSDLGLWPDSFTLSNYVNGWRGIQGYSFGHFLINSFIIAALAVIGNVISCSLAAFAFARLNFGGQKFWFSMMLMTLMLPFQVTLIPQYILFHSFGWVNTFLPLVVPKFFALDAFFVLLMVQFIRGLPMELDESARIDGCGPLQIYLRIIMPLCVPAVITTSIFTFYWTWDDFFGQMIYLNSPKLFTVMIGLRSLIDSTSTSNWGSLMAMSTVAVAPVIVIFLIFQRYIVEGISTTGLK
ncbi:ABC transporter permease [Paenibacillus sp. HMSSN-139]|nr:ABC transporter permease [Paenibacillus sp. HMSSN-139]